MSRRRRIALWLLAAPFLLLLTAGGLLFAATQTDFGREQIRVQIERAVSTEDGLRLTLGPLTGDLFSDFQIAEIGVADPAGDWLHAEKLRVTWDSAALLNRRLTISALDLESLHVKRAPQLPDTPGHEETGALPSLPLDIQLQSLRISRINLDESLTGREALFELGMSLNAASGDLIQSRLDLRQLEGGQALVTGLVAFHPEKQTLGVDITLSESEGGVIARTLELPGTPAVELSLVGDGPLDAWQGQLLAQAGELIDANLLLVTDAEGAADAALIHLDVQGTLRASPLLPPELAPFAEPQLEIESRLAWSEKRREIALSSARVSSSALDAEARAAYGLEDGSIAADLTLRTRDTAQLEPLTDPLRFAGGEVDVSASGDLNSLAAQIRADLRSLELPSGITLQGVALEGATNFAPLSLSKLPLKGTARLQGLAGLPQEAADVLGPDIDLAYDLQFDVAGSRIVASDLAVQAAAFRLTGRGDLALESQTASSDFTLVMPRLAALEPLLNLPISGALRIDGKLQSQNVAEETFLNLQAATQELDLGDPKLNSLTGKSVGLRADITAKAESIEVTSLDIETTLAKLTGSARLPASFDSIHAAFETTAGDLSLLTDAAGTALTGSARLSGEVRGNLADPGITGNAVVEDLTLDAVPLGRLQSDFSAATVVSAPKGELQAQLFHPGTRVDFQTAFALHDPERLDLKDLSLSLEQARISGALSVPLTGAPVTGQLAGEVADLGPLAALAGQTAAGSLTLTAALIAAADAQNAEIRISAANLLSAPRDPQALAIESLEATLFGQNLLQTPSFKASLQTENLRAGNLDLDGFNINAEGSEQSLDFNFSAAKAAEPALTLDGNGELIRSETSTAVTLSALEGRFEQRAFRLLEPLSLQQTPASTSLEGLKLSFDGGEITGSGLLEPTRAQASLQIKDLPLSLLALLQPQLASQGSLNAEAVFSFSENKASGRFRVDAKDAKPEDGELAALPALNGRFSGELAENRLSFDAEVSGLEDTAISATGFVPLEISLDPGRVEIPQSQDLEADLQLRGDLAKLWPLLQVDDHLLAGKLAADLKAGGSLSSPQIEGTASLTGGRYESLELGTLLTDMELSAQLDGVELILISLTAQDGDDGSLKLDGTLELDKAPAPRVDMTAELDKARLLRRDDILAQASGAINLAGTPDDMAVSGEIATDLVEINIGGALPASIVELPVEEKNRPGAVAKNDAEAASEAGGNVDLDLTLSLPRRVFIRGRGLDSEWSGVFKVNGTAEKPIIEGELSPVRGDFSFAGKSFALQKGNISLVGGKEIDPDLDLSAVYEVSDFKAIVAITGTASRPEIGITSEPELPQDEIVAQILFGKSTGELSTVEALQLAEAVASVSGQLGSGEGIMGLVRNTIGVDVLSAGTNEENGEVEVRAGKYLTDDVFVGVTQGADPTSTRVTVEVEVTPNISVESDVGQDDSGRVGVFWKFDY